MNIELIILKKVRMSKFIIEFRLQLLRNRYDPETPLAGEPPNVAKAGELQSQGVEGEIVVALL